jgi:hypothetical protein
VTKKVDAPIRPARGVAATATDKQAIYRNIQDKQDKLLSLALASDFIS